MSSQQYRKEELLKYYDKLMKEVDSGCFQFSQEFIHKTMNCYWKLPELNEDQQQKTFRPRLSENLESTLKDKVHHSVKIIDATIFDATYTIEFEVFGVEREIEFEETDKEKGILIALDKINECIKQLRQEQSRDADQYDMVIIS